MRTPLRLASFLLSLVLGLWTSEAPAVPPLELRGTWVLDSQGKPVPPQGFRRGLQPSGLAWRKTNGSGGELWCVGDQRSQFPGAIFRIDPSRSRLIGEPWRLALPEPTPAESPQFAVYRSIPNSDFEGLCTHPSRGDIVYAVTEDKTPWVVEIAVEEGAGAACAPRIRRLCELQLPDSLKPWRSNPNFRMEGLAVSEDAKFLYLAYERAEDELPHLFRAEIAELSRGGPLAPLEVAVRFDALPAREDKPEAKLNLNDVQFLSRGGAAHLVALARDQERILLIDLAAGRVTRWLDLDLRDPAGERIYWVSPEGLALDRERDRLWIVNDPDSERGNYRKLAEEKASGEYADYVPLLFEMKLSTLLEAPKP